MGFHLCAKCQEQDKLECSNHEFSPVSSGDVELWFFTADGQVRGWEMPDMILHYIADHGWYPGDEFIGDLESGTPISEQTAKQFSPENVKPVEIGYLSLEQIVKGKKSVSSETVKRLDKYMQQAASIGQRGQTKGL